MAENLWRAGAVDNIFAPYDWSNGSPLPGETLVIKSGTAFLVNSGIYGDTVLLDGSPGGSQPKLVAYGNGTDVSVLVTGDPSLPASAGGSGTVEIVGAPHVSVAVVGDGVHGSGSSAATVNIDDYSKMRGGFNDNGALVINGTGTSTFANTASSVGGQFATATINADVVGAGTFDIGYTSVMSFTRGVSSGQTINDNGGDLQIEFPRNFHASVNLSPVNQGGDGNFIALYGLSADHSSYRHGVLSLLSGGKEVYDLRLHTSTGDAVAVQTKTGVNIYASASDAAKNFAGTVIAHA